MGDMQFNGTPEEWDALVKKSRQTTVKLYTEEQVKDMLSGFIGKGNADDYLNRYYTPIQLPTDEEIEKSNPYGFDGGNYNGSAALKWQKGVEWMRDKILNK